MVDENKSDKERLVALETSNKNVMRSIDKVADDLKGLAASMRQGFENMLKNRQLSWPLIVACLALSVAAFGYFSSRLDQSLYPIQAGVDRNNAAIYQMQTGPGNPTHRIDTTKESGKVVALDKKIDLVIEYTKSHTHDDLIADISELRAILKVLVDRENKKGLKDLDL